MRIHHHNKNNISRFPRFRKAARIPVILLLAVLHLDWVPSTEALSVPSQSSSPSPSVVSLSPPSSKTKSSADASSWVSTTIQTSRRGRTILHDSNSSNSSSSNGSSSGGGGGNETEHAETSGTTSTTSFACTHTQRSSAKRPTTAAGYMLRRLFPIHRIQVGLFLWYWLLVGNLVLPGALPLEPRAAAAATLSPPAAAAAVASCSLQSRMVPVLRGTIVSTLWLGFVLAISGMEAWVKFRAPFCPRAMALDIGRTVFPALNAVETALCALCWQQEPQRVAAAAATKTKAASPLGLVVASIVLALDVLLLTPALVHRGETIVLWHFRAGRVESGNGNGSETEAGNDNNETTSIVRSDEWEAELTTQNDNDCRSGSSSSSISSSSSSKNGNNGNTAHGQHLPWHALYVVLECAKVLALGSWIGFLVASCLAVQ